MSPYGQKLKDSDFLEVEYINVHSHPTGIEPAHTTDHQFWIGSFDWNGQDTQ